MIIFMDNFACLTAIIYGEISNYDEHFDSSVDITIL